jgi:hypothetical protein
MGNLYIDGQWHCKFNNDEKVWASKIVLFPKNWQQLVPVFQALNLIFVPVFQALKQSGAIIINASTFRFNLY